MPAMVKDHLELNETREVTPQGEERKAAGIHLVGGCVAKNRNTPAFRPGGLFESVVSVKTLRKGFFKSA